MVFAYVALAMKFEIPYEKNPIDLVFNDARGNATAVQSFGCSVDDRSVALHGQARVLFDSGTVGSRPNREFAIDPCGFNSSRACPSSTCSMVHS